jgi:peptide/nickel transport system substrate-binding protein
VTVDGAEPVGRRHRISALWARHRSRWTLPLVIIVIIVIVAAVDHIGADRIRQVDQPPPSGLVATPGGSATVYLNQGMVGFNPNTSAGATSATPTVMASVLPSAYIVNPQNLAVVNAALLQSVEVIRPAPLTISYVINPKAVWSDGTPVTAQDFIYAWESQRGVGDDLDGKPYDVASTLGYRDIDSITPSTDGKTVTVLFGTPFTDWRVLFANMVPAHIAEQVGWNTGFQTFNPARDLSAGPMTIQSVSPDGTLVLVPNSKWWGAKPRLSRVVIKQNQSSTVAIGALSGSNRAVSQPDGYALSDLSRVTSLPNVQSEIRSSMQFLQLEFNVKSPVTGTLAVRQAIAHSLDRSKLLNETLGSVQGSPAVDDDHLAVNSQPQYATSKASAAYAGANAGAAETLMSAAGYTRLVFGPYEDIAGRPIVVRMAVESGDPWIAGVADLVADQLEAAGFGVVTVPVDGVSGLDEAARSNSYDMALVSRTASTFLTSTIAWYSEQLGAPEPGGSEDWSNYTDPTLEQLFRQASQELNPVNGATYYAQIDTQLWNQMIALPLFQEPAFLAYGVQLGTIRYNPSSTGLLWNVADWTALKPKPMKTKA